jgi:hypothetical protein
MAESTQRPVVGDQSRFGNGMNDAATRADKKKRPRSSKTVPAEKLDGRLVTVLERYRARWDPKELAELACQLRWFADSLDSEKGGKKRTDPHAVGYTLTRTGMSLGSSTPLPAGWSGAYDPIH